MKTIFITLNIYSETDKLIKKNTVVEHIMLWHIMLYMVIVNKQAIIIVIFLNFKLLYIIIDYYYLFIYQYLIIKYCVNISK